MPSHLIAVLLAALALVAASVGAGASVTVGLCGTGKGFAGELNHHFDLTPNVEVDPSKKEAIVVAVRPIPYIPGQPGQPAQAILTANYTVGGQPFNMLSDGEGLVIIRDPVPKGTRIDISVANARTEGSTPFLLYSYVANRPECFLDIAPERPFFGPVPGAIAEAPARMYFASRPPGPKSAFLFDVLDGVPVRVTVADSAAKFGSADTALPLNAEHAWDTPGLAYIAVEPTFRPEGTRMMRATISWRLDDGAYPPPPQPGSSDNKSPGNGDSGEPAVPAPPAESRFGFLGFVVFAVVVYFVGLSIYNYKVRGERTFPEYIPHHKAFQSFGAATSEFVSSLRGQPERVTRQGAYTSVNNDDAEEF